MEQLIYLVAVPKGKIYHCSSKIQRAIWEKYNLWEGEYLPEIHVTIDAYNYRDKQEVETIRQALKEVVQNIPPFEIYTNGFSYIPAPYNCITVHIVKTKELKKIYSFIHRRMIKKGFEARDYSPNEIVFHISIAGTYGRKWDEVESQKAWEEVRQLDFKYHALIDEF
ncbi:MAG: 2'-5' RNA ligase family protein, partial [Thermotaleaceae bacterium]